MRLIFTLIFSGLSLVSLAQADSSVLSFESFISLVKNHHPVALQAEIKAEMGLANLRSARGNFDPKLQADLAQKYFEDKEYYDLGEGKLKIPTWFGIELEGGYERNEGQFLNPENTVPASGLWFAGISVPVGEGLFIDERRASLRKAQAMVKQNEAERDALLNELLMNAGYAYWDWFNAYYNLKIYEEALVVTQQRLDAVKLGAELGDRPDIDTLEAGIQQQNRELNLQQAQLEYRNATAFLSIYLWQEGVIPVERGGPQQLHI